MFGLNKSNPALDERFHAWDDEEETTEEATTEEATADANDEFSF